MLQTFFSQASGLGDGKQLYERRKQWQAAYWHTEVVKSSWMKNEEVESSLMTEESSDKQAVGKQKQLDARMKRCQAAWWQTRAVKSSWMAEGGVGEQIDCRRKRWQAARWQKRRWQASWLQTKAVTSSWMTDGRRKNDEQNGRQTIERQATAAWMKKEWPCSYNCMTEDKRQSSGGMTRDTMSNRQMTEG